MSGRERFGRLDVLVLKMHTMWNFLEPNLVGKVYVCMSFTICAHNWVPHRDPVIRASHLLRCVLLFLVLKWGPLNLSRRLYREWQSQDLNSDIYDPRDQSFHSFSYCFHHLFMGESFHSKHVIVAMFWMEFVPSPCLQFVCWRPAAQCNGVPGGEIVLTWWDLGLHFQRGVFVGPW